MPRLEIHYADEWAALYVDGALDREYGEPTVGDRYRVEERAFELLRVRQIHDDAFMRGQNQRDGVARTLDEVAAYQVERHERKTRAERLRAQAEALLAEAKGLDA